MGTPQRGPSHGEPGDLVYVALGDSAAQGIGASTSDNGYVGLVADRLRERTGNPVLGVNLSRSGATVHISYSMHGRARDNAGQAAVTIRALATTRGLVVTPL